ncbi:Putative transposase [Legionella pneumophila]|uniref:IS91 family transposase n=1 Tax=Legionella pneumophila TaxID=446 RepID=UPI000770A658|nr:IS91 family transposase [Legionella pneumophila]CZP45104.1 Putative transposase [Legionella pneumophila]CZP76265.1 Putative transposase [Legionella pneumophila]CZP83171.1 Putative transposase [Legionella pneumophila]
MFHSTEHEGRKQRLELADIFRHYGQIYMTNHKLCSQQYKTIRAIVDCRTASLGGHISRCDNCKFELISYNSCRNRHCPKCQAMQKERWINARAAELLPTEYFHVVFTLPHHLNPLAQGKPEIIYNLLFQTASETLLQFSSNPKWLGAKPSITMVLHTWGQSLDQHIHVHCIISGGGLTKNNQWKNAKRKFLFPVHALSKVFRGKYIEQLKILLNNNALYLPDGNTNKENIQKFISLLYQNDWVVYAKSPFAGPEQVLSYLGRYTHRIAIGNQRLINFQNNIVSFKWRDYADNSQQKIMLLNVTEFTRRYLLHVLPKGFQRLRHYGILANRYKSINLKKARIALNQHEIKPKEKEKIDELMLRLTGIDITSCPRCGSGQLNIVTSILSKWVTHSGDPPIAFGVI